jgi:meso-butanediol dehydrogenase/(S,S)-butanediol dehydrogenase/diacetyl reductase
LKELMQMKRERAIVTGATSGIGTAIAHNLARRGAIVGLVGRNVDAAHRIAEEIAAAGGESLVLVADVSDPDQLAAAVDLFVARTEGIDTVVASAGIAFTGTVLDTSIDDWRRMMAINVDGVFHTAKFTMPHLLVGGGNFIAIGSDASVGGASAYAAYCTAKHALVGLVRCLVEGVSQAEQDFYRQGVPIGRFAKPDEVASVVAHLASPDASYANGMVYSLDGGSTAGYFVAG